MQKRIFVSLDFLPRLEYNDEKISEIAMADCTHDCSSCSSNCSSRDQKSFIKPLHERARGAEGEIYPVLSRSGIQMMSMNCLLENDEDPVIWRGTLIAGAAVQFWTDVVWDDVDIMFIDMPPGTGDVPLSVFQSIPISGAVIVTTPQDLVEMIVKKAVNMAKLMNVPILGLAENMSYFTCPDCGKRHRIFGESKADALGKAFGIPAVAKLPIDPAVARLADEGKIELADTDALADIFVQIERAKGIEKYKI